MILKKKKRFAFVGNFCAIFEKEKENIAIVIKFGEATMLVVTNDYHNHHS